MKIDYDIDQRVPFIKSLLLGIQWAAIIVSTIVILGQVVGNIYFISLLDQALYFQKLLFISAITLSILLGTQASISSRARRHTSYRYNLKPGT